MPAYGGPRYPIVQLLHRMWPRRSTIAELVPHCATPGEFSVPHHPEGPSPGSLKNITPLTSRVRSGGLPVLRTPACPLPTRLCRLLTRLRVWGATIPAHAAAARITRSAAWTEGLFGPPCQACYDMRRVPHKLARLAVLRS